MYTIDQSVEQLTKYFKTHDIPDQAALDTSWVLAAAEALGLSTHGVARASQYMSRVQSGGITKTDAAVVSDQGPVTVVDGRNGLGPAAMMVATRQVEIKARNHGIALAFVRHSNHFGPTMPYLIRLADHGIASYVASNASPTMAAWGGNTPVIGNSPFGWGMPGGSPSTPPILVDMALSQVARAKIRAAQAEGVSIPDTWATAPDGLPTTDPAEALKGLLQPMAAHKGFGLSTAVDFFTGVLTGASYSNRVKSWSNEPGEASDLGHMVMGVDLSLVRSFTPDLDERIDDFQHRLLTDAPTHQVRLPGQHEYQRYVESYSRPNLDIPSHLLAASKVEPEFH